MNNNAPKYSALTIDPAAYACTEARVLRLSARVGDDIQVGDTLVEFECDKAAFELTAPVAGKIVELFIEVGQVVSGKTPTMSIATASTEAELEGVEGTHLAALVDAFPSTMGQTSYRGAIAFLEATIQVREADVGDAEAIAGIWSRSTAQALAEPNLAHRVSKAVVDWYVEQIASEARCMVVAVEHSRRESRIVGYIDAEILKRSPTVSFAIIGYHVQNPNASWSPYRSLCTEMFSRLRREGVSNVVAITDARNVPGIRVMNALGFRLLHGALTTFGDGKERVVFEHTI